MVILMPLRGTILGKRQLNGRLKRTGNGNYGRFWFHRNLGLSVAVQF